MEFFTENESKSEENSPSESDDEIFELATESGIVSTGSFVMEEKTPPRSSKCLQSQSTGVFSKASPSSVPKSSSMSCNLKPLSEFQRVPGSVPSFLRKKKNETSPPAEPATTLLNASCEVDSLDIIESLKEQVHFHNSKAIENKERAMKLSKSLDQLRNKLSEVQNLLRLKDSQLKEKIERTKITANTLKQQRDKIEKLKLQVTNLKKQNSELEEKMKAKSDLSSKLESDLQNLKHESNLMLMSNESLVAELTQVSRGKKLKKEIDAGQKIENLEIELNSRDLQIDILKLEMDQLKEENVRTFLIL